MQDVQKVLKIVFCALLSELGSDEKVTDFGLFQQVL